MGDITDYCQNKTAPKFWRPFLGDAGVTRALITHWIIFHRECTRHVPIRASR